MPDDTKDQGPYSTASKPLDNGTLSRRKILLAGTSLAAATSPSTPLIERRSHRPAQPQPSAPSGRKPNILVIWGDDVGVANISAYSNGLMGYETPSIDRIGRRGSSSSITTASSRAPRAARRSIPVSTAFAAA